MRIRTILAAAAAPAALAAALLGTTGTTAAHAATHAPASSTTIVQQPTGNGKGNQGNGVIAKQTFSYTDDFGPMRYNETQHPAFDTVSGTFTGGQTMTPGTIGSTAWISDFTSGPHAGQLGTMVYTVNASGTGFDGQATYPAS